MADMTPYLLIIGEFLAFCTFAYIFFADHPLYPLVEGIILGGTRAFALFSSYRSLMSSCITPISTGRVLLIVPLILGLLAFSRYTRFRWLSRYPTTVLAGIGVGTLFGLTLKAQLISNVTSTVNAVLTGSPDAISGLIIFVSLVTSMTYFLYSAKFSSSLQPGKPLSWVLRVGRMFLFGGLGYLFVTSGGAGGAPSTWLGLYVKEPYEYFRRLLTGA